MSSMSSATDRHVDLGIVEGYFEERLDGVLSVEGEPPARLVIAASDSELALRLPASETAPDITAFSNIRLDFIDDEGVSWHQMSVRVEDNLGAVYAALCGIIDRVQLSNTPLSVAVDEVLDSLAEILARRRGLSEDQQLGLAGELLTFLALADTEGFAFALEAWMGPLGEEHDFALPASDIEVKVTLGERRQHWISSVTQLVPTPGRHLYLLSFQLTPAGAGSGWSLPTLVELAHNADKGQASNVDIRLDGMGYRSTDSDLYIARWTFRSKPQFFAVDDAFPAISPDVLTKSAPSSNRIVDVRYRIDLTGLPTSDPLFSFDTFSGKSDHV